MQNFYRKTIYDWIDAMNDSCFVDTAPFVGIKYCGLSWESAFLTTQYHLFLYYNDTAIIHELYDRDLEWMKKVERLHPNGIVETGLSDHESLEPVPVQLTGTAHYLQCARIMKTFASYMGDVQHEKHFERLKERLRKILQENFWNKPVIEPINKQTLFSTLLYHNIIPKDEVASATDSLLASLGDDHGHFKTGIFGTKYILEALSNNNHIQTVFDIVNSPDYPGWGYMVSQGATTIWETWKESDDVYSNCHPMFGSVTEWFYRWLGGIRPHPDYPGFEKFIINPFLPDGLDEVSSSYYSPYGKILSNWKRGADGNQNFEVEIPVGSSARFKLPESEKQNISFKDHSGKYIFPEFIDKEIQVYDLPSGSYTIVVQ
jgi:alpha-L-rhamnosidase